ncbi:phosphatase PAP2 family protein [Arthrobacter monumenti]
MQIHPDPRRYSNRALAITGGSFLAAFGVLALMAALGSGPAVFQPVDAAWYGFIQEHRNQFLLQLSQLLDWVGYDGIFIFQGAVFVLLLKNHLQCALFAASATISVLFMSRLMKFIVDRARPEGQLASTHTPAFPSGHTTATVAAVVAAGFIFARVWIWVLGACLIVLVMFSRTYLQVHWLFDTVAGLLLAAGIVALLWVWFQTKCAPADSSRHAVEPSV